MITIDELLSEGGISFEQARGGGCFTTPRRWQFLSGFLAGRTIKAIANELGVTPERVRVGCRIAIWDVKTKAAYRTNGRSRKPPVHAVGEGSCT